MKNNFLLHTLILGLVFANNKPFKLYKMKKNVFVQVTFISRHTVSENTFFLKHQNISFKAHAR